MNWESVGDWLKDNGGKSAALVGSLLTGNAPGAIAAGVSLVASATGTDDPGKALETLQMDPEAQVYLDEIAYKNKDSIRRHLEETLRLELQDKQNARAEHKNSAMPAVLSITLTLIVALIVYLLFYVQVPTGAKEVLFMMLGIVAREWAGSMQYWFGTTRSSSDKNKLFLSKP